MCKMLFLLQGIHVDFNLLIGISHYKYVTLRFFYPPDLNLLDWSCNNHLAVALGSFVYLWNAQSGEIVQLCQMDSPDCYVSSVSWIKEGNFLSVGNSNGEVQVKDDHLVSKI